MPHCGDGAMVMTVSQMMVDKECLKLLDGIARNFICPKGNYYGRAASNYLQGYNSVALTLVPTHHTHSFVIGISSTRPRTHNPVDN